VVPGMAPSTNFATDILGRIAQGGWFPDAYEGFARHTMAMMEQAAAGEITTAQDVAEAIFRAATDTTCPVVLPAGADAAAWSKGV